MKYLIIIFCLTTACVMPSDIRALKDNYASLEAGTVTLEEFKETNEAIIVNVEERSEKLLEQVQNIPTSPLEFLAMAAGALATLGASVKTTNVVRDKRRVARKEPV